MQLEPHVGLDPLVQCTELDSCLSDGVVPAEEVMIVHLERDAVTLRVEYAVVCGCGVFAK